jgi:hypothetical protein
MSDRVTTSVRAAHSKVRTSTNVSAEQFAADVRAAEEAAASAAPR